MRTLLLLGVASRMRRSDAWSRRPFVSMAGGRTVSRNNPSGGQRPVPDTGATCGAAITHRVQVEVMLARMLPATTWRVGSRARETDGAAGRLVAWAAAKPRAVEERRGELRF